MAQTPDQIRENIAVLQDDILYLEHQLDDLDPDSPAAESKDRVIVVKWLLLLEQKALLQHHEIVASVLSGTAVVIVCDDRTDAVSTASAVNYSTPHINTAIVIGEES